MFRWVWQWFGRAVVEAGLVKRDARWAVESQVRAWVPPPKQSMSWVVFIPEDVLCFSSATLCSVSMEWRSEPMISLIAQMTRWSDFLSARLVFPNHSAMPLVRLSRSRLLKAGVRGLTCGSYIQQPDKEKSRLGFYPWCYIAFGLAAVARNVVTQEFTAVNLP